MTALDKGLTQQEAEKKLQEYGFNQIQKKKRISVLKLIWDQLKSPLIYILIFAGVITLFLHEYSDAIVIFLAVGINVILGFIQEFKAEKSLQALRKMVVPHAKVIRSGKRKKIEAKHIVPGDVVIVNAGDRIPADGILLECVEMQVNEAILTGESRPVEKKVYDKKKDYDQIEDRHKVFMGTAVVAGRGKILIKRTGKNTKMGRIAKKLVQTADEDTPLRRRIKSFSQLLTFVFVGACTVIFIGGLLRGESLIEIFELSVAIAVAAIPEGLAISLTVILTLGMRRILKRKGLVRRLLAAETLGSVDVICADKTGTLTQGKMQLVDIDTGENNKKEVMLQAAILCNNQDNHLASAMLDWVKKEGQDTKKINQEFPREMEVPFSSQRKFISVLVKENEQEGRIILGGAPEKVLKMANVAEKEYWHKKLEEYTSKGLRLIAFAQKKDELENLKEKFKQNIKKGKAIDMEFLGLLLFEDPVRLEVKNALKETKKAGIDLKVITGDYQNTAEVVLEKLDIVGRKLKEEEMMSGNELKEISQDELRKDIKKIILFYRTTPEQKIRIVEALQSLDHIVAMMGDGVNDSLALKKADIGVVVGEASEVSKETADMVLLDSNFQTIIAAIEEGRGIFNNLRKVVLYLLSDSFTEVVLIGGSLLLGLPMPILPAQILWINLVEDSLPGLALAFEPKEEGLMQEKPRKKDAPIIDQEVKDIILIVGGITNILLFAFFYYLLGQNLAIEKIRSLMFASFAIDSILYLFSCKTLKKNLWEDDLLDNKFLLVSAVISFGLLLIGIYLPFFNYLLGSVPFEIYYWLLIFAIGIIGVIGIEFIKWIFKTKSRRV